jgi:mitochondrial fission protein ELM1
MVSEACATTLPVFVAEPGRAHGRISEFLRELVARGRVRTQRAALEEFECEPLRAGARVAARVRQRLNLR